MTLRDEIVANARWGVANEPQIHYSQGPQRFAALDTPRALPLSTDCSAFATLCYAWAGAPDPNGLDYNGTGFTGTLLDHLEHITANELEPGDLIVFGPGSGDHVVIAIDTGPNPMCVSHGQERGPISIRLSVEAAAHRPPMTFLRGEGLDTPPEDDDMTEAEKTELFATLADLNTKADTNAEEIAALKAALGLSQGTTQTGIAGALTKDRRVGKLTARKAGATEAEITAAENG